MNPNKKKTRDVNDEVEELLRAAEDATLLKLNLNSHTVHASSSDLNPDLEQRFRNLKTGSKPKSKKESITRELPPKSVKENKEVEEDDLLARFAALKATLPKPSASASSFIGSGTSDISVENKLADEEDDEDDEVEKVIRWAMDAACLDPSPDSGDEDTRDDDDDDYDDDADDIEDYETSDAEDAESPQRKPKGNHK